MDGLFATIRFFIGCGTLLLIATAALAHLPKSPLRATLMQICGWATACLCGAYIASPLDIVPDVFFPVGFIDDLVAVVIGLKSVISAWNAGKEKAAFKEEAARQEAETGAQV